MPVAPPLTLPLPELSGEMLPLVGGKAANLGVLARAGLPVPPGVCLTTEAYRRTVGSRLDEVLVELAAAPADGAETLRRLAARARDLVLATPVPDEVAEAVRGAAVGPVAVRSSATAEDLPYASFAGQQDTFLNVTGADAVVAAVRRCWASLWSDRAVSYRAANGLDHRSVHIAVVIQAMVPAAVAGVMFTANPVTGTRRQAVIDASYGLGEAVVSGAVNPDRFIVDTAHGLILERRIGDKKHAVRGLPGGGTETVTADVAGPCLTDQQIQALAAMGARVEAHYGAPQDTEWAIGDNGVLWLTQARPITTLYPLPDRRAEGLRVYFSFSVAQGVFRPMTPMGISCLRAVTAVPARLAGMPLSDPLAGAPAFTEAGGRVFLDVTPVMRSAVGRAVVPRLLDVMETRTARILRGLFADHRLAVLPWSRLRAVARLGRVLIRHRIPPRIIRALRRPATARWSAERVAARIAAPCEVTTDATASQRLDAVERMLTTRLAEVTRLAPPFVAGFAMLGLAARLLRGHTRPGELSTVLRGLPHNVTTEMGLELWQVAVAIRQAPAAASQLRDTPTAELAVQWREGTLPAAAAVALTAFLDRYGHRAVAEIDAGLPRWSDDPTHLIGVVANYLRLEDDAVAPDVLFAKGAAEAEAMIAELSGRVGPVKGAAVRFALGRARELAGLRELPKFAIVGLLAEARAQLGIVGAELVAHGRLSTVDDVYFVTLPEARAGLAGHDLRAIVAARRETYDRELRRRHLPRVLLSDGTEPEAAAAPAAAAPAGALTGIPGSAGAATGTARVVRDPVGASLQPGEILVCPSTDPGWTPLFLTAGGLVMEMGGVNSHGAVVAREYGIPAVVGVADATTHIPDGAPVTVDGTAGTVCTRTEHDAAPEPAGTPVRH